jgi:hypothetical protein
LEYIVDARTFLLADWSLKIECGLGGEIQIKRHALFAFGYTGKTDRGSNRLLCEILALPKR